MKSFLKDNPTITLGLAIPMLLVVIFLLVSGIPNLTVDNPKYDVLYTTEQYYGSNPLEISVVDSKVQVIHRNNNSNNGSDNNKARLWRYNAQTGAVKEIPIRLPDSAETTVSKNNESAANLKSKQAFKATTIDVAELDKLTVDSSSIAPDGYEFNADLRRSSRGFLGELFYSNRQQANAILLKNGRSVRLPSSDDRYYRNKVEMVGWVVSE